MCGQRLENVAQSGERSPDMVTLLALSLSLFLSGDFFVCACAACDWSLIDQSGAGWLHSVFLS